MRTIRVVGGIYDKDKPGWEPDPHHASKGTYEAVPEYITGDEHTPTLAVIRHAKDVFTVVHAHTGLAVPGGFPGVSAAPGLHPHSLTQFRTKTAARTFMMAVAGKGILPADRAPSMEELLGLKLWLDETYTRTDRQ